MKRITALIALLVCGAPGFAAETAVKKSPYYRPHRAAGVQPRQSGGTVIVNAASYESGVSPGGLATIFGNDLTTVSGVVLAGSNPLPTHLAGVQVFVSGIPAPIYGIAYANGQDQISIQVPYDAPTGPGAAEIEVVDQGAEVADFSYLITELNPNKNGSSDEVLRKSWTKASASATI